MGVVDSITPTSFPKQSDQLGWRTKVHFHYDTSVAFWGTIVRDDYEDPWRTIIHLDTGLYVLATECQYSVPIPPDSK